MTKKFHLGWFLEGSSIQSWGHPWTGNIAEEWMYPRFFIELAQALERAKFDYVLLEDSSYVGKSWNNSTELYLRRGISVPRQEPSIVATLLAQATSRIGIVPTLATFTHHPYLVARIISTLDQVSAGRIGWNMVTGSSDFAARNFGLPGLPEHDLRYDMADEYIDCVRKLWASWEPGAIVNDLANKTLIDPDKVHAVDFEGQYYKSMGPLNSGPSPQGQPVVAQAGGSPRGRAFASRHADTIVAHVTSVAGMKDYKDDLTRRLIGHGRAPDSCKLLFMIGPIIAPTEEEARLEQKRRQEEAQDRVQERLAFLGKITNINFMPEDLDKPVEPRRTNGHQQSWDEFCRHAGNRTLRQVLTDQIVAGDTLGLVGSAEQVAIRMGEIMQECGGDGFLLSPKNNNRRALAEVTEGLVPELQRRGLTRTHYDHDFLRDNLLAF